MCNEKLSELIFRQLGETLFSKLTDGKSSKLEDFKEYILRNNDKGLNTGFDFELKNKIIQFNGVTFTKENNFILDKLYKIKFFDNCVFEFDFKINSEKTYYFEKCIFNSKLIIKNCNTFDENALFDNCDINKIEINDEEINSKLFDFCKINELNALRVIFKKEPFFDTLNSILKTEIINEQVYKDLNFNDCKFEKKFFICQKSRVDSLEFSSCSFFSKLNISVEYPIENLKILFCTFKDKVDISQNIIKKDLCIENSIFNENIILDNSNVDGLLLEENIFNKLFSMADTKIDFFISEKDSFEMLNLRRTNFNKLDLEKIHYIGKSDLSGIKGKLKNRETARIIKDSFEQQNNIIEANKFYALEMKEREKELDWKKDFFNWIVFKAHGLASNHSQNWLLPIFWIIFLGLLNSYFQPLDFYTMNHSDILYKEIFTGLLISLTTFVFLLSLIEHKIYYNYISSFFIILLVYLIFTNDIYFSDFANSVNPFSIMTKGEELSFGTLIYKIIIAYLIYQLIVSIRQNTRRK